MTFTQIMKDIFVREPKAAKDNSQKGGVKRFLSKISGAFMLPISVMAIAGLFLGVGAAIADHTSAVVFGKFIKAMGDPVFGSMPILFMVAIVISFTDDIGTAVFAGIVSYVVFNALQEPFISTQASSISDKVGAAKILGIGSISKADADQNGLIANKFYNVVGSILGQKTLNTSVFGGIIVGFVVAWLFNKFSQIELPSVISFFGGKRFVPIVGIVSMIPLAFFFLLIWPWIGTGFAYIGTYSGKVSGLDSFVFGYVERALIPFGLHHVFYSALWWTAAGGDIQTQFNDSAFGAAHQTAQITAMTGNPIVTTDAATGAALDLNQQFIHSITTANKGNYLGDSFGWQAVAGSGIDKVSYKLANGETHSNVPVFEFIAKELKVHYGRFMHGKFAFMQFGLPAAGAAMVMAAPKENRKMAFAVVFPAALTSFVTGVTEPIEFTFVFLAPVLFWGFHAVIAGLAFMGMTLLGAHVGMTFSGGFIDALIYGALQFSKGTNFYWMYAIGAATIPLYYFSFLWYIKKYDLDTPGRGGNTKLFTKKDLQASKDASAKGGLSAQGAAIVAATGGWDNITKFSNCATRLRYDVKDVSIVDDAALKAAGAMGISRIGTSHVQIIMGPAAEQINGNIKANIGAPLNTVAAAPKAEAKEEPTAKATKAKTTTVSVKSVLAGGTAKALSTLKDGVFSEKMMGDGVAVAAPANAKKVDYFSPVSGEVVVAFPTGHAYGIKTDEGVELLIHIGIDTVKLDGRGFEPAVKQGDKIKAGDKLVTVDIAGIKDEVPTTDTVVIVTSGQEVTAKATGKVTKASVLFKTK